MEERGQTGGTRPGRQRLGVGCRLTVGRGVPDETDRAGSPVREGEHGGLSGRAGARGATAPASRFRLHGLTETRDRVRRDAIPGGKERGAERWSEQAVASDDLWYGHRPS